jgi:Endoplasmic reticulum vesicle transporter/Endoplasmic Reticulum-Golgi Intermediate Compartment (ERGIC)
MINSKLSPSSSLSWRRLDTFQKARSDVQQRSTVGGVITLFALLVASILLLGQIIQYIYGTTTHSLSLSQPIAIPLVPLEESKLYRASIQQIGRVPLQIHITFPHNSCDMLDVVHDGASLIKGELDQIHGYHSILLRTPTNSELKKALNGKTTRDNDLVGCTVTGQLRPLVVAGTVAVTFNNQAWATATSTLSMMNFQQMMMASAGSSGGDVNQFNMGTGQNEQNQKLMQQYNVSHYVHKIQFGRAFAKQNHKPLENVHHFVENDFFGIAVVQTQVKLVPTAYRGGSNSGSNTGMYQSSVVDTTIQPRTLVQQGVQHLPGLILAYDFTPLTVNHSEGRDNIFVFISSLISIVGGVYVTVSMLTGCLVHSAQAVAKKMD